ncbi:MAG: glycine--tRNA ligase subunit beta [bacterium]
MKKVLIEVGCEEIPARMLADAVLELESKVEDWIVETNIVPDYPSGGSRFAVHATARRMVIEAQLPEKQSDTVDVIKGPPEHIAYRDSEPTGALQGFCRQNGIETSEVVVEELDGGHYVVARRTITGRSLEDCLKQDIPALFTTLSWPKKMRWEESGLKFVRPLRWLLALVDDKPIDLNIGPLSSGNKSRGLRFGKNSLFEVQDTDKYFETLKKEGIIVSLDERKTVIHMEAQKKAESLDGEALFPGDILNEVTNLVEAPTVFVASFEEEFLQLPEPVLVETMVSHQKYFPVVAKKEGCLLPRFIAVRNGGSEGLETVRRGNQRVLRARLNDARFFYDKDLQRDFEAYREDLRGVVFQKKLGSLYDKTERLAALANQLPAPAGLDRLARHCKNDQVTEMVDELPALQGVMAGIYARESGWTAADSRVIEEHYLPSSREGKLPASESGCWLSLIDRLDTLVGFFALGERPSGAKDPYGLRRDALGLLRVILSSQLDIDLKQALKTTIDIYRQQGISVAPEDLSELQDFLRDRLYHWLCERESLPADQVAAVTDVFWFKPLLASRRLKWLADWKNKKQFDKVITAAQRVVNISSGVSRSEPDPQLFEVEEERALWQFFKQKDGELNQALQKQKPQQVLEILASFKKPVDEYFEQVMVMCDDQKLRENRLAMLREIKTIFDRVADFSAM